MNLAEPETLFLCGLRAGDASLRDEFRAQGMEVLGHAAWFRQDLAALMTGQAERVVLLPSLAWQERVTACLEVMMALKSGCRFSVAEKDEEGKWILQSIPSAEVADLVRQSPSLATLNQAYDGIPTPSYSIPTYSVPKADLAGDLHYTRAAIKVATLKSGSGGGNTPDEVDTKDSETVNEPVLDFQKRAI